MTTIDARRRPPQPEALRQHYHGPLVPMMPERRGLLARLFGSRP